MDSTRMAIEDQYKNGAKVIVHRCDESTVVESDCNCLGSKRRLHSNASCPVIKGICTSGADDLYAGFDPQEWDLMSMDGYDDCIVGVVERFGQDPILCYDKEMVICQLESDGLTRHEAEEFFYFNQIGGWVGDSTPCFLSANAAHTNHHSYKGGVT